MITLQPSVDSLRRVMRIEQSTQRRDQAFTDAKTAADSQFATDYYPIDDSDPKLAAPPRPSEERWYAENCYMGRAR